MVWSHDGRTDHDMMPPAEVTRLRKAQSDEVEWGHPKLVKIRRLQLIGWTREIPRWDVSECYGELADGSIVRVNPPFASLPTAWWAELDKWATRDGIDAMRLGFFDPAVFSTLTG